MQKQINRVPVRPRRKPKVDYYPPQIVPTLSFGHRFRFQSSAATTANITVKDLGDLLCMATSATAAYQLANAVRIRSVEIWGPPSATLVPVTVSCEFSSTNIGSIGPSRIVSDTSVGSARVAHIKAKPPMDSQASLWQVSTTTTTLFTLVLPAGAIVDIKYSLTMRDTANFTVVTGAVTGATTGVVYLRPLDSDIATPLILPVSYISI